MHSFLITSPALAKIGAVFAVFLAFVVGAAAQNTGARPPNASQSSQPANNQPAQASPGQTTPAAVPPEMMQKLGIIVTPKANQSAERQQRDESECYLSAKQQTGIDPEHPANASSQAQTGGSGKGAAGGAAVGAVAGPVGAAAARRHRKKEAQAKQQQQQARQQQAMTVFKNAMTTCLQGRNYSVQ